MTEKEAYIAFNLTEQIGSVGVAALVEEYGSVVDAWEAYPKKVSRNGGEVDWRKEVLLAKKMGVDLLTAADEAYPEILRSSPGRPLVLYVKGNSKALSSASIALIGTRRATPYGLDQAHKIAFDLASSGWCIVSGLALGIDAEAHRGALEANGLTIGIIGSGLDKFYPEENRSLAREIVAKGGAVVSEFPFGRSPDTQTFPQRNHVVAALARGVLAIEAPMKSGTLITTNIAADLGRQVMALPSRVDSRSGAGCLRLIRDGAILVRDARDVIETMSELIPTREPCKKTVVNTETKKTAKIEKVKVPFTLEESLVMKHVNEEGISIDEICRLSKLPASKVNTICMTLRVKGRVRFFPGNRVALPRQD